MENISDALKIAFGLLVFVTAITFLFIMTTHTRSTADLVLSYADDTNYYTHINSSERNREVTVSDVITTLYRYYNESITVEVKLKGDTNKYLFDVNNETNKYGEKVTLTTIEQIEENLGDFINNVLLASHRDSSFLETFVEVPTSGIYLVEDDGTELTLSAGSKKIYITYEEI